MNKLAVITGATRGIGLALAHKFGAAGLDLVLTARGSDALEQLRTDLSATYSVKVFVSPHDLADKSGTGKFCAFVHALGRPVNVLINNAGYFIPGKVTEEGDAVLDTMLSSNLVSAYRVTRGLLPLIPRAAGNHIFNMCSIASFMAYPNGGSYTISKFALLGFSKVLREELKPSGIRVTAIMPGATLTPSWEGANLPEERLMRASDVADTVFMAWSLSDRSVVEEIIIRPQLGDL